MKILIPMGGKGKRFIDAGYAVPKPLIKVDGKPVIEHIVNNFSKDDVFVFGCSEEQLQSTNLANVLKRIVPECIIVSMPYKKGGPVYGLQMMKDYIDDEKEIVVNYCDFSWYWDYDHFKNRVKETSCDGAVVCYRGFHPHLLGPNMYATVDADGLWMKEIREKHTWHKTKMEDWSSSGTYYFKKGSYLKKYIYEIEKKPEWKINGEFYASQLFQLMKNDGLNIFIYEIPYMLQWGTPEDLEEYIYSSESFSLFQKFSPSVYINNMNVVMPMAGAGKRFLNTTYNLPKPLIQVDNYPMFLRASLCLPRGKKNIFQAREEIISAYGIEEKAKKLFSDVSLIAIDHLTDGQASTVLFAESFIDAEAPLLIGACDNGMVYDEKLFLSLVSPGSDIDALIFTFRKNPAVRRRPEMYGWVSIDSAGRVKKVSVKIPISNSPINDHAVVGSFWFKKGKYFVSAAEEMIKDGSRINGEFYIDNCMNYLVKNNLKVHVFEVEKYICWGTPDDLRTYEYWSSYFNLVKKQTSRI